jgi:hypothetical protein
MHIILKSQSTLPAGAPFFALWWCQSPYLQLILHFNPTSIFLHLEHCLLVLFIKMRFCSFALIPY